jgi:hypothetical protein
MFTLRNTASQTNTSISILQKYWRIVSVACIPEGEYRPVIKKIYVMPINQMGKIGKNAKL